MRDQRQIFLIEKADPDMHRLLLALISKGVILD